MLGGSCSACCVSCKPARLPDYVEVDVASDLEDDIYASLRYRTGRNYVFGQCETEHADAYLLGGIKSQRYRLDLWTSSENHRAFVYFGETIKIAVEVDVADAFSWPGRWKNFFGRGFDIVVEPLRIVAWKKEWPTYSGLSAVAATQEELREARPGISSNEETNDIVAGIRNIKYSIGDNSAPGYGAGLTGLALSAAAIRACVGGDGTLSTDFVAPRTVVVGNTAVPMDITAGWLMSSNTMTDDLATIQAWNPNFAAQCGREFPYPYFISAGGAFSKAYDGIERWMSSQNGQLSLHVVRYDWPVSRSVSITHIVGRMNNGDEVPLV